MLYMNAYGKTLLFRIRVGFGVKQNIYELIQSVVRESFGQNKKTTHTGSCYDFCLEAQLSQSLMQS